MNTPKQLAGTLLSPSPCSRLADYLESPPPYRKHVTKERLWLVLDAHGDSVLWSDQELAVDSAVAALNAMHKPKCTCGEDSTGWVEIKSCNICGLPHKDETLTWSFSPANDQDQGHSPAKGKL